MTGTRKIEDKNVKFGLLLQTIDIFNYEIYLGDQKLTLENITMKYNHRHLNNIAILSC